MNPPLPPPPSTFEERLPASQLPQDFLPASAATKIDIRIPVKPIVFHAEIPPEFVRYMVDEEREKFELHVLEALYKNSAFFEQTAHLLCIDPCPLDTRFPVAKPWPDFAKQIPNALYECLRRCHKANFLAKSWPS